MKTVASSPEVTERIAVLRNGSFERASATEIASVVDSVLATMDGDLTPRDIKVYRDIEALARFIQNAKSEIAAVRPTEINDRDIPMATDELDAVVGATEEATGKILDAAELLERVSGELPPEQSAAVSDAVTSIYEACNFQDVTGQRISKVVKTLRSIEDRVAAMLSAFGEEIAKFQVDGAPVSVVSGVQAAAVPAARSDEDLLHGPSLPDDAKKQAEIDAILASFD
jgi:chemotaxis protein CheZ